MAMTQLERAGVARSHSSLPQGEQDTGGLPHPRPALVLVDEVVAEPLAIVLRERVHQVRLECLVQLLTQRPV